MSGQLPTILVLGAMLGGVVVLLNPELRCSLLGLCGTKQQEVPPAPVAQPVEEGEEDDNGNPVYNIYNPAPVIVTPRPQTRYIVTPSPVIRYATNGCCECKTHTDGIVRCRSKPYGDYTISYSSAKYDINKAASLCAKNKCNPQPQPQPQTCPTQISKNGTKYYLTNLTKLPDVMTMQYPPTYVKEGRCIYQLLSNPSPQPQPQPEPVPQTSCNSFICKTFPFLCGQCQSSNLALSLHGYKMSVH